MPWPLHPLPRLAEPAQQEEHRKLSKHAKKRAKEDRERQIREAELRRLQVRFAHAKRGRATPHGHPQRFLGACVRLPRHTSLSITSPLLTPHTPLAALPAPLRRATRRPAR